MSLKTPLTTMVRPSRHYGFSSSSAASSIAISSSEGLGSRRRLEARVLGAAFDSDAPPRSNDEAAGSATFLLEVFPPRSKVLAGSFDWADL